MRKKNSIMGGSAMPARSKSFVSRDPSALKANLDAIIAETDGGMQKMNFSNDDLFETETQAPETIETTTNQARVNFFNKQVD